MSVGVTRMVGNCLMWSDAMEASNYKQGDDARITLRRAGYECEGWWGCC